MGYSCPVGLCFRMFCAYFHKHRTPGGRYWIWTTCGALQRMGFASTSLITKGGVPVSCFCFFEIFEVMLTRHIQAGLNWILDTVFQIPMVHQFFPYKLSPFGVIVPLFPMFGPRSCHGHPSIPSDFRSQWPGESHRQGENGHGHCGRRWFPARLGTHVQKVFLPISPLYQKVSKGKVNAWLQDVSKLPSGNQTYPVDVFPASHVWLPRRPRRPEAKHKVPTFCWLCNHVALIH